MTIKTTALTLLLFSSVLLTSCGGGSSASSSGGGSTLIAVPTGLTANTVSTSEIDLSWNAVTGAATYVVYRGGNQVAATSATTFQDTGLSAGTSFSYQVAAKDSAGNGSALSAVVVAATQVLAAPTGLAATGGGTSIALTWNAVPAAASYIVYRNGAQLGTPTVNSFIDTGVTGGTNYSYRVAAKDSAGNVSAQSGAVIGALTGSSLLPPNPVANPVSSSEIDLTWGAVSGATSYVVYRNGEEAATVTTLSFNDTGLFAGTSFDYQVAAADSTGVSAPSAVVTAATLAFVANDVRVGDFNASYGNVEVTDDNKYLVWFEQSTDGSGLGTMWHCAVDPATGALNPPNCKGYNPYDSTAWGRANTGVDSQGVFYVGMNRSGQLILVRPNGYNSGTTTILSTPADPLRRAIYPTDVPNSTGYVFWIRNSDVAGAGYSPAGNTSFTLQYISLADPSTIHDVATQPKPTTGFAPMDEAFARWFRGKASLSYGAYDAQNYVQVKEFDVGASGSPYFVTNDAHDKIDTWSMAYGTGDLLLPGIDGTATTYVYQRSQGETLFTHVEDIVPPPNETQLTTPWLAQSNQSIIFDNKLYTAYQVDEQGATFYGTITNTGEIWLSTVLQSPPTETQWLVSGSGGTVGSLAKSEPEPYIGTSRVWVFYSAVPNGSDFTTATWQLRRADTPIGIR